MSEVSILAITAAQVEAAAFGAWACTTPFAGLTEAEFRAQEKHVAVADLGGGNALEHDMLLDWEMNRATFLVVGRAALEAAARSAPATHFVDPVQTIDGRQFMADAGGRLVPLDMVKPAHKLEDQTVRKITGHALDLSARISRFRGHTFDDIGTFVDLLAEQYQGKRGGKKGNLTITSYDGTQKVAVQVQDQMSFGPELQVAKSLVDECITTWSAGASDEMRALVEHAFQVDKEGRINRAALFQLRRLKSDNEQWRAAMDALSDAIRVIGSREYVRIYRRDDARSPWLPITIDLAQA